jgi:nucleotide-binding universal stress UspA family protein
MLEKILVPLDGSPLSDRIVSHLTRLLMRSDALVTLVEVVSSDRVKKDRSPERVLADSKAHLEKVAAPLRQGGARVETRVLCGDPAERILIESIESGDSLIVMATHGRTGIERWTRGSVAERVLREARVPILLANPFGLDDAKGPKQLRFAKILVPLDGSEKAAAILPYVARLAQLYEAEVTLHYSIPIIAPVEGAPPLVMTDDEARTLLAPFQKRLEGVKTRLSVSVGDPAVAILELAEKDHFDLVAMTTHGRTGFARWVWGSVAEHVLRHARCPLLVHRTAAAPTQATE